VIDFTRRFFYVFGTQPIPFCPVDGERVRCPLIGGYAMDSRMQAQIAQLRADGESYARIAEILDLSINTIKSFCRRKNLGIAVIDVEIQYVDTKCKHCGIPLIQNAGKKRKQFCSDQCRMAWWKGNRNTLKQTAWYKKKCDFCRKTFNSYGNKHRKYCSHSCYIQARFGRTST
jgi:endogenous inhibitor of DNA gyrase (YacG/DUF329 family)